MKKVIALTLSLMFVASNPQSVYAGIDNRLKTESINVAFCFDEKFWMQADVCCHY